jgi:hypothetical protein
LTLCFCAFVAKMTHLENLRINRFLFSLSAIFIFTFIFGFTKILIPDEKSFGAENFSINPSLYLATLTFDGNSLLDGGETNFPISFSFNSKQDANNDGKFDVEDDLENLVLYSIGDSISGTGKTKLTGRKFNDQRPAVYFHFDTVGDYQVYEYWLYYADNDWINNHEHDWEKYFVYVKNNVPQFIRLSHHNSFTTYRWNDFPKEDSTPVIGVHRGSHAMHNFSEDGVKIRFDGKITANKGKLLHGNNEIIPWIIYSNDKNVVGEISFSEMTETFYYGDPSYAFNGNESGDGNKAPWKRSEWENPPMP